MDWDKRKAREQAYLDGYFKRRDQLREREKAARVEKVRIMNMAGLACSEADPDYYMFHNPFVGQWHWIDFDVANEVLRIEAKISTAEDELRQWKLENDPWYTERNLTTA